jgi:acetyl-CoA carboxylase biotin carboxyl carrier protein
MTGTRTPLQQAIDDARALIDVLTARDWQEVHVVSGETEIFIAKNGGSINPMRAHETCKALPLADDLGQTIVKAPHVGTIVYVAATGAVVANGQVVARLRVLDTVEDIVTPGSGRIAVTHAKVGTLVEFDAPIIAIRAVQNQPRN